MTSTRTTRKSHKKSPKRLTQKQKINKILDKVYTKVKTYDDLLNTGIMYLKGDLPQTWLYGAAWGEGADQTTHATAETTKTLIELHKKGVFTYGGQSSACGKLDNDYGWLGRGEAPAIAYKQRSGVGGFIPVELAHKVLPILKEDKRIYIDIKFPKGEGDFTNVPYVIESEHFPGSFNVTLVKTSDGKWHEMTNSHNESQAEIVISIAPRKYPNIKKVIKEQAFIGVDLRKYCKGPEADSILLDAINKVI